MPIGGAYGCARAEASLSSASWQGSRTRQRSSWPATASRRHRRLHGRPKDHGSNVVYKRLRERGYEVFAVNPNADEVEGDRCYHDLSSIPGGVDGVVIATRARARRGARCASAPTSGSGTSGCTAAPAHGSVSETAADYGREHGIAVIDGGCPCMFGPTADRGHKAMRAVLTLTGNVPREV